MTRAARRTPSALLMLCAPLLLGAEGRSDLGAVRDVRSWSYADYTRVVVEFDQNIPIEAQAMVRLAANPAAQKPDRLYLDIPGIWVGTRFDAGLAVGDGLLKGIRLGQNKRNTARLVIDLERYDRHRLFALASPPRLVVDVYAPARGTDPDASALDPSGRLPVSLRPVTTVVVDPGHGGRDPGATGRGGILEKEVNLAIAKEVANRLRAKGFEVVLTRSGDETVDLEERTAIAESSDGDVFLSIHANSSARTATRGIEIYTLDSNHERHSLDVASRENGVPAEQLDVLQRALAQLRADEAARDSERLAHHVHEQVVLGAQEHDLALPDLGLKKGPFYVLFMSSMPSLLVETGFLTNRKDVRLLSTDAFQKTMAEKIADGVARYRADVEAERDARIQSSQRQREADRR